MTDPTFVTAPAGTRLCTPDSRSFDVLGWWIHPSGSEPRTIILGPRGPVEVRIRPDQAIWRDQS